MNAAETVRAAFQAAASIDSYRLIVDKLAAGDAALAELEARAAEADAYRMLAAQNEMRYLKERERCDAVISERDALRAEISDAAVVYADLMTKWNESEAQVQRLREALDEADAHLVAFLSDNEHPCVTFAREALAAVSERSDSETVYECRDCGSAQPEPGHCGRCPGRVSERSDDTAAQTVSATGRPSEARRLGAEAVDEYGGALRKLAEDDAAENA
jgi:hypothetical protein